MERISVTALEQKFKTLRDELKTFPKSELLNLLVVKEVIEGDGKDLWWAVDKDGTGHLFETCPERLENSWVTGSTENTVKIGTLLNEYYEKEIKWEDEPVKLRLMF